MNVFPHPIPTQATFHFCRIPEIHILQCKDSQDSWRKSKQGMSSGPAKEMHSAAPNGSTLPLLPAEEPMGRVHMHLDAHPPCSWYLHPVVEAAACNCDHSTAEGTKCTSFTAKVLLSQLHYPALLPAQLNLSDPLPSDQAPRALKLESAPAACRVLGNSLGTCLSI